MNLSNVMSISKVISALSIAFFAFILWIIYLANTGQSSVFFNFVASIPFGDKLGHFGLFGLLSLGANFAFKLKTFQVKNLRLYAGSLLVLLFVILEELSQYFIPNRTLDIADFFADALGIIAFHFITKITSKSITKRMI